MADPGEDAYPSVSEHTHNNAREPGVSHEKQAAVAALHKVSTVRSMALRPIDLSAINSYGAISYLRMLRIPFELVGAHR